MLPQPVFLPPTMFGEITMTKSRLLGAAAILAAAIATPAMAQPAMQEPGAYAQADPWASDYHYRYRSGFWPGDVAAGVVGGAIGAAGAIASAPFRDSYVDDSYAYYRGSVPYDDSYAYYDRRPVPQDDLRIAARRDLSRPGWTLVSVLGARPDRHGGR